MLIYIPVKHKYPLGIAKDITDLNHDLDSTIFFFKQKNLYESEKEPHIKFLEQISGAGQPRLPTQTT